MTRQQIIKALADFAAEQPDNDEDWRSSHLVDFALMMVRRAFKKALGWRLIPENELGENHFVEIDGARISFHVDAIFQWDEDQEEKL